MSKVTEKMKVDLENIKCGVQQLADNQMKLVQISQYYSYVVDLMINKGFLTNDEIAEFIRNNKK